MAVALHDLSRQNPHNRLSNADYQLSLLRRLRLPIFPAQLTNKICRYCYRPFDPYGDNLFSCKYHKAAPSNAIRDALGTVCRELGPLAGFIASRDSVSNEPTYLIASSPNSRPADIGLQFDPHYTTTRLCCCRCLTIPFPPSYQSDAPFVAVSATRPHHLAERKKFRGGSTLIAVVSFHVRCDPPKGGYYHCLSVAQV
jgi:hypothetical protein